jgi:YVTN family beta-propeller protein
MAQPPHVALAPLLDSGEDLRFVVTGPVVTLDTFLGPFSLGVTNRRIVVARRSWTGRIRKVDASYPLGTPVTVARRVHGWALRIDGDGRWFYVPAPFAAAFKQHAGDTNPSTEPVDWNATPTPAQAKVIRRIRRGQRARLALVLAALGGAAYGLVAQITRVETTNYPVVTERQSAFRPYTLAFGHDVLWAVDSDRTVQRIDPHTGNQIGRDIRVGFDPSAVAVGLGGVWVANYSDDTVTRLDPSTGAVVGRSIAVGRRPDAIAVGSADVWVANAGSDTVSRIDPATNAVTGGPIAVGRGPDAIAVAGGSVWVADEGGAVSRIESGKASSIAIGVGGQPDAIAVADGTVWVADALRNAVVRIDPRTDRRTGAPIAVGADPVAIGAAGGSIWVVNTTDNTVSRLDAGTGRAVGTAIGVGMGPTAIAVAPGSVWVYNQMDGTISHIDPRTGFPLLLGHSASNPGDAGDQVEGQKFRIDASTEAASWRSTLAGPDRGPIESINVEETAPGGITTPASPLVVAADPAGYIESDLGTQSITFSGGSTPIGDPIAFTIVPQPLDEVTVTFYGPNLTELASYSTTVTP